jgi:hypothetical protein
MDKRQFMPTKLGTAKAVIVITALVACAPFCEASIITVTFEPTQPTPIGQSGAAPAAETAASLLSYWGVTFGSSASDDPTICGGAGPLCFGDQIGTSSLGLNFLTDDVLSGSTSGSSVLTLTFASATTVLNFGAVVGTSDNEILSVQLIGAQPTATQTLLLQPDNEALLSEGVFTYSGAAITQAQITFSSDAAPIFAIDNLTFNAPDAQVPEPNTVILLGSVLLLVGFGQGTSAGWRSFAVAKQNSGIDGTRLIGLDFEVEVILI